MNLSINQLSRLTGKSYRTITPKLEGLPHNKGPKGAMHYNSAVALERIYAADSEKVALDQARAKQALSQASLNAVREEDLRRERIPRQIVKDAFDETFQAIGATLKAAENKVLTAELINELFDKFRVDPEQWSST